MGFRRDGRRSLRRSSNLARRGAGENLENLAHASPHLLAEVGDILPYPVGGGVLQRLYLPLHTVRLVDGVVPEHVRRVEELEGRLRRRDLRRAVEYACNTRGELSFDGLENVFVPSSRSAWHL